ncbi:Electron transfer flavoprotein alpha-subunit [Marasmius crinis-equi]|uniref:Probable electron transfer flavoprotein subunit alpha n=1 Tax=Marasmius crinis-equi TaxID=585013 RepID=A0ABR3FSW6_9AGAR
MILFAARRRILFCKPVLRAYSTASSPHALIFIEHRQGTIEPGSLSALTAAEQLGGKVTGLVVGGQDQVPGVVDKVKKLKGLSSLLHSTSDLYAQPVPEAVSPLLEKILSETQYTHVVSAPSSFAKSLLPRIAAKLNVQPVSEITSLEHDPSSNTTTFTRPIYAGNAVSTVRLPSSVPVKFFTVRGTSFDAAPTEDSQNIETTAVDPVNVSDLPTQHVKTHITKSDRPDLGVASRVVSGGRPLKDAETFQATLYPLADVLGAAVGASRAAVDAGYADNSLQVGQTGKVVAPELYIALGISGAIQHLAGMKDSKMIVAVNKDPDAPIFQVADAGLVGDLYEVVPELIEKLKQ